ncbi:sugar ABC transporter permease [Clostridium botulinum]|uniref:Sugar ABC transporter permease n=1 Tax=Clostridium botulinum TaxID=1491 RepID=A0A846J299_CLOBO|nr:sugar ABC transporter permease [Clostridium botulinum]ACA56746.1 binding-protein-dependent transport systems inner membrane component [Clostridium botulinum A3 str. Loch Maree]NFH64442.1 sugar ABC transporter permease [Clostridium botulinum]NFJ08176.1 sugar ABC transporter permease [Clostridium botulinum]NFK15942.1 sugar ABC transporter permease [Clostridium botulinum]NFM93160.1 sugar ABC transporter permease [Clostridium botulinum]
MIKNNKNLKFIGFTSPWIIGFLAITLIPMISSIIISLTEWNILTQPKWVGIKNYIDIFNDPLFYKSLKVTLLYTAFSVPINVVLSLFVALLLNNNIKHMNMYRTIYYLPAVVSGVVVSLLWAWIFNPEFGLLNNMLSKIGIEGCQWIYDEKWVIPSLIIMGIWGIGGGIIIYLSGLQSIPKDLYEAAKIDGASFWQNLIHITIPSMSPILLFTTLTSIIGSLQTFTQAYVMTEGGPNHSSLFYAYYVYKHAFTWHKMGKACALAWILFLIILFISLLVLKVSSSRVYYEAKSGGEII